MYSSIKKKRCKCGCGKMPSLSYDGWNYACAPDEIKEKVGNKRKQAQQRSYEKAKIRSLHSLPDNRSMVDKNKDGSKDELALYFAKRMSEVPAICDNCGAEAEWIKQPKYYKLWKAAQAHLLEKRHFKSIQTHPLNFLTLFAGFSGVCDCHDDYDHDWERASKMNVWEKVIKRFKILYPLIAPEERKFIPQALLETLK